MPPILGIDPGKTGGIAVIGKNLSLAYPMPKTEKDILELITELAQDCHQVYIEKVGPRPNQAAQATFTFAQHYGFLRGVLHSLNIPFDEVTPQKWQKNLSCLTGGDKNISKAKAQQLYPTHKITHLTADALLIATYGYRTQTHG